MGSYLFRRLLHALAVFVVVIFTVSMLIKIIPGDIVDIMLVGNPGFSQEDAAKLRDELGVSRSVAEQFIAYTTGLAHGDMGQSIRHRQPVADLIGERIPATLELTLLAMVFAALIAIPLGVVTALRQGSAVDYAGSSIAILGVAIPGFLLGILLILVFSVQLNWLPPAGRQGSLVVAAYRAAVELDPAILWASLRFYIMPAIALAVSVIAINGRLIRSAMLEVLRQDYILFAKAKGLSNRLVYIRHGLRNAMIPTVTILGLQLGFLISGTFIIENVFAWPGLGRLAVEAIMWRDVTLIQGTVLVTSIIYVTMSVVIDVIYCALDPRIDYANR